MFGFDVGEQGDAGRYLCDLLCDQRNALVGGEGGVGADVLETGGGLCGMGEESALVGEDGRRVLAACGAIEEGPQAAGVVEVPVRQKNGCRL